MNIYAEGSLELIWLLHSIIEPCYAQKSPGDVAKPCSKCTKTKLPSVTLFLVHCKWGTKFSHQWWLQGLSLRFTKLYTSQHFDWQLWKSVLCSNLAIRRCFIYLHSCPSFDDVSMWERSTSVFPNTTETKRWICTRHVYSTYQCQLPSSRRHPDLQQQHDLFGQDHELHDHGTVCNKNRIVAWHFILSIPVFQRQIKSWKTIWDIYS